MPVWLLTLAAFVFWAEILHARALKEGEREYLRADWTERLGYLAGKHFGFRLLLFFTGIDFVSFWLLVFMA